jgi:cysteine-rich repeat protein
MSPAMPLFPTLCLGLLVLFGCGRSTAMNVVDAKPATAPDATHVASQGADSGGDVAVAADLPTEMPDGLWGTGTRDLAEVRDDGNTAPGDGCSWECQLECDWCPPCLPGQCVNRSVCGNGVLTSNEVCDDGNETSGDGCSGDCAAVDPGWRCRAPGRLCTPICGDGMRVGRETCDDGNASPGDGCSAFCLTEHGWDCTGGPCVRVASLDGGIDAGAAQARCGDGLLSGAEECDLGDLNDDSAYGGCTTACAYGSFCGDSVVNEPEGCDLGKRNGALYGEGGCTLGCTKTHYCGDGIVDANLAEECDLGDLNDVRLDDNLRPSDAPNARVLCTPDCKLPWVLP